MSPELKRILYVEDDEDIAEVAQMTLEDLGGYVVKHCSSGQAALDAVANYAPQMVLMDVMMPDMDGPETLRRLRQRPDSAHLPVVFMTAKAQIHEQETYRRMGAVGVIVKPFNPTELCPEIQRLWEKSHD